MAFSYDRYERQQRRAASSSSSTTRSALTYWVPLIITVTAATAGAVAWVWNERGKDGDEDDDDYEYYDENDTQTQYGYGSVSGPTEGSYAPPPTATFGAPSEQGGAPPTSEYQSVAPPPGGEAASYYGSASSNARANEVKGETVFGTNQTTSEQDEGFVAQMRGAIRRTPSPQKMLEGAGKRVAASMAAVGKGLSSIGEETGAGEEAYVDHERWSEEAESRDRSEHEDNGDRTAAKGMLGAATSAGGMKGRSAQGASVTAQGSSQKKKRTVAVVVSAAPKDGASVQNDQDSSYNIDHASLLSHLIGHVTPDTVQLLILIYAPHLRSHPLSPESKPANSTAKSDPTNEPETSDPESRIISSYSDPTSPTAISSKNVSGDKNGLYAALTREASTLTTHETHIMPFTTPSAHVHLLKHLAPNLVYMQESLCGPAGEIVDQIGGWVGQCVVVIGAEGAGLVDTETEDEGGAGAGGNSGKDKGKGGEKRWWMDEQRVGLGKGVEIVEGMRLGEDWSKRVETR